MSVTWPQLHLTTQDILVTLYLSKIFETMISVSDTPFLNTNQGGELRKFQIFSTFFALSGNPLSEWLQLIIFAWVVRS